MKNLTVIENELVPVYETSAGEKVVYGSELHEVLGVKSNYREWVKRRFSDIDAIENEDFDSVEISTVAGGTPKKDHIIKLDTAKEMAMLERNEKGKQIRRYFIEVEKKYKKEQFEGLSTELQAIIMHDKKIQKIETRMDKLEYDIPLYGAEADELCNHVKRKGVAVMGGKESNAYKDTKIRSAVYTDIYNQLKREFGLYDEKGRFKSYKALKRRYIYEAHELIDVYELPVFLKEQVNDCNSQLNLSKEVA
ncbi:ORF6C domain-containing protein [Clostridium fessum]|uniref:ORF6C domain-containing protein n=1 Tax=Clostridium fessum TaxID=2126740 RepID=UPI0022E6080E|nr:ORF6C domain-containing protein [Clostridium fessum]